MEKKVKSLAKWEPAKRPSWKPGLGNPGKPEEDLALSILSALSIAGIHSAINPSIFTLMSFASHSEAKPKAMTGLWIGLGASTLASGAIWVVFKEPLPAVIAELTAIGLFAAGVWAVNQPSPASIPQIQNQNPNPSGQSTTSDSATLQGVPRGHVRV